MGADVIMACTSQHRRKIKHPPRYYLLAVEYDRPGQEKCDTAMGRHMDSIEVSSPFSIPSNKLTNAECPEISDAKVLVGMGGV